MNKRALICTFSALAAGAFGAYLGGQIGAIARSPQCPQQIWGVKDICQTLVTADAFRQGSPTGLWMGAILGAFMSGLLTHSTSPKPAALRRLLLLIKSHQDDLTLNEMRQLLLDLGCSEQEIETAWQELHQDARVQKKIN